MLHRIFFFDPRHLIVMDIKKSVGLQLHGLTIHAFQDGQLERGIVFNPTLIKKLLTKTNCDLTHILLRGSSVQEGIHAMQTIHAQRKDFPIPFSPHCHVEFMYIYSYEQKHFFYTCTLLRPIILQYQLLLKTSKQEINTLSSARNGLFLLYKKMYGSAFRTTQFALDMIKAHNHVERLFSKELIPRVIDLRGHYIPNQACLPLLSACGIVSKD